MIKSIQYLLSATILFTSFSFASPRIYWEPKKLVAEHEQGVIYQHEVAFTPSEDTDRTQLSVVPELAGFVTLSKTDFASISRGVRTSLTITVDLSKNIDIGKYDGVVHVHSTSNGGLTRPLPILIEVIEKQGEQLPPDPGEAGMQTLLGIDSDNDGVRDDIQRYIILTYPDHKLLQLALLEIAKHYQISMTVADDKEAARAEVNNYINDSLCLHSIVKDSYKYVEELKNQFFNTRERSIKHIQFSNQLAGSSSPAFPPKDEWSRKCAFDVNGINGQSL